MHIQKWWAENRHLVSCYLIALSCLFFVWQTAFVLLEKQQGSGAGLTDFAVYYVAGQVVVGDTHLEPKDIYRRPVFGALVKAAQYPYSGGTKFLYSPPTAFFFVPFALLPIEWARQLWALGSAFAIVFAWSIVVYRILNQPVTAWQYPLLLMAFSQATAVERVFFSGQINGYILLLLVLALFAHIVKSNSIAGIALGIATLSKLFPALFIPYLILRKQWDALCSYIIVVCGFILLSFPYFGVQGWSLYIERVLGDVSKGNIGYLHHSTSLFGSLRMAVKEGQWDWLEIPRRAIMREAGDIHQVVALCAIAVLLMALHALQKQRFSAHRVLHAYMLILLTVMLFSPSIHPAFHLWLLPGILFLFQGNWGVFRRTKSAYLWQSVLWLAGLIAMASLLFWSHIPVRAHATLYLFKLSTAVMSIAWIVLVYVAFKARSLDKKRNL